MAGQCYAYAMACAMVNLWLCSKDHKKKSKNTTTVLYLQILETMVCLFAVAMPMVETVIFDYIT